MFFVFSPYYIRFQPFVYIRGSVHLREICLEFKKSLFKISKEAWRDLINYHWSGNVRELITIITRVVALCGDNILELMPEHLELNMDADARCLTQEELEKLLGLPERAPIFINEERKTVVDKITSQREIYEKALGENGWHVTNTARTLGIKRATFVDHIKALGIELPSGRRIQGHRRISFPEPHDSARPTAS